MNSRLFICIFVSFEPLAQSLVQLLSGDRYILNQVHSSKAFLGFIEEHKEEIDCLVVLNESSLLPLFNQLYEQGTLLPVIMIVQEESAHPDYREQPQNDSELPQLQLPTAGFKAATHLYHSSEVRVLEKDLDQIASYIDQAITQFLHLGPNCAISERQVTIKPNKVENRQTFLMLQQRRLAEKLKERLGYLGVYYKRNPQYFYRNLSSKDKKEFLEQLREEYRDILLNYFSQDEQINQDIDQFVNRAFFADLSVSLILEIHMELIDEFAQQLKLEGRSEEILLDYRLTLIDMIAHLGEMYRRSIPREDFPFEVLFPLE
ncbi:MAG: circadian clock protein KaiA [Moorea sp. SIO2B7]|nr:circadian clock protein KaiA [Moorena sp. SIO2B7]